MTKARLAMRVIGYALIVGDLTWIASLFEMNLWQTLGLVLSITGGIALAIAGSRSNLDTTCRCRCSDGFDVVLDRPGKAGTDTL